MTPQALIRVDGAVLGIRTETIEALPATADKPARPGGSYAVADVASQHVRYDGELRPGLTAVLTVILDDDAKTHPAVGEVVSWLVYPYPTARKMRQNWVRIVGLRFVAPVPSTAGAAAPARSAA